MPRHMSPPGILGCFDSCRAASNHTRRTRLGGGSANRCGPPGSIVTLEGEGELLGAEHRRHATDPCHRILGLASNHPR